LSIRIVSWNILQGGGKRAADIADALRQWKPDVLVCQEFRNGKSSLPVRDACDALDLAHTHISDAEARKNTVMLASRFPFEIQSWDPSLDIDLAFSANINLDSAGTTLSSLSLHAGHIPQKKKQIPYLDYLYKMEVEEYAMIIGDLNCGIPFEDSDTKSFDNTHMFQSLFKRGWTDSWRSRNPTERQYSWVSSRGNGYRYDHCLCTKQLDKRIENIKYDHEVRESRLSDHSALIVELADNI